MPGSRAASGTTVAVARARNWEHCATLVPLQPCCFLPHCPFAPADRDAGSVEPMRKVLLSKPPLATAPRRREPLAREAAKGPGYTPLRTRGQVLFLGQHHPAAPPALPKLPSRPRAPRCVLLLISCLGRAACPALALSHSSAATGPSERSCSSSQPSPTPSSPTAELELGSHSRQWAATSAGGSHVPPWDLPQAPQ